MLIDKTFLHFNIECRNFLATYRVPGLGCGSFSYVAIVSMCETVKQILNQREIHNGLMFFVSSRAL